MSFEPHRRETALQAALARAGYSGGRDHVYARVAKLLNDVDRDRARARKKLLGIMRVDGDFVIAVADFCVQIVDTDMDANLLLDGGQTDDAREGHAPPAPVRQTHDEAGAKVATPARATKFSPPSSSPHEGERGQVMNASNCQEAIAPLPSPHASGRGHIERARKGLPSPAPSARPDTAARKAARINAVIGNAIAATSLDSYKVRDGRAIGDLSWGELERLEATNQREAWVIRQIRRHAVVADHSTLVRAVITPEMLDRMIQKAAELSDAY